LESETPPGLDPEARASNQEYGQRTGDKGESFERFRMALPNINLLSTNRTDTLVRVAKAFTDYPEADYHLLTEYRPVRLLLHNAAGNSTAHQSLYIGQVPDFGRPKLQAPASIEAGPV
jgi:hypothetical protein